MKKFYFIYIILLSLSAVSFQAYAQCPTPANTDISPCWDGGATGAGTLTFTFNDGVAPDGSTYRIRLYDYLAGTSGKFVYDSNNPDPSLNDVDVPTINANQLTFGNLPSGDYVLLLGNGGCGSTPGVFYGNGFTGGFTYAAIGLDASLDIVITIDSTLPDCGTGTGEINLSVTGGEGTYSYVWTGPTAIGDVQDPTNLDAGTYQVTVIDGFGCTEIESNIIIGTPTVANAGPAQTICASTTTLAGNAVGANETGTWSVLSEPATATASISSVNDPSTSVTNLTVVGDYTFRWTISDDTGTCIATESDVVITVKELTVSNAGPAQNICVDNTTLAANAAAAGETGTWTVVSGSATFGDVNVENTTVTGLGAGDNVLRWTISDDAGICTPPSASTVTITYTDVTVANAGPAQTICASTTTLAGNAVGANETGTWSVLSEPATASASISSVNDPSTSVTNLTVVGDYTFRWTISDDTGTCIATESDVVITVKELTVSNAGPAQNICVDNTTLAANAAAAGETGTWTVVSGSATFGDVNVENTTVTGLSAGDNVLRWTISDDAGICAPPSTSTVTITYTDVTVANAGPAQTICASTTTLAGNAVGANETGTWSVLSEPATASASISSVNDPSTSVTNLTVVGDYTFRWTISDDTGTCIATNSDVVITVKELTVSNAGPAQNICVDNTTLAANAVAAGETGTWTVVSGSATFGDVNVENTTVTGLGAGDNVLRWTISDDAGICAPPSTSTVTITYTDVTVANAGPAQTICASTTTLAGNAVGANETGTWSVLSEPATASASISSVNDPSTSVTNLTVVGDYTFRWTISDDTGTCIATDSDVVITVKELTVSNAGPAQNICVDNTTLAANAAAAGETGTWTVVSGSATFGDVNVENTTVTGLGAGDNVLRWTISDDAGICAPPSTSTVTITYTDVTVANAGPAQTICASTTTLAGNAVGANETGTWSVLSEPATASASISSVNDPSTSVTNLTVVGDYTFRWTISDDTGTCIATDSDVVITVKELTVSNAGPAQNICVDNTTLAANAAAAGETGTWTVVSGSATFGDVNVENTTVTGLGAGDNVLRWTISDDAGICAPPSTSTVTITYTDVTVANAGPAQTICASTTTLAGNAVGANETGTWSVLSEPATASASISSVNDPSTSVTNLTVVGDYTFRWTISDDTGTCIATDSDVVITVKELTVSNAGPAQNICVDNTTLAANAAAAGETGTWTVVSGSATFGDVNVENTTVTGLGAGDNVLRWTISDDAGICAPPSTSTVTITYTDVTVANAGPAQTICASTTTLAGNAVGANETGTWSVLSEPATASASISSVNDPSTSVTNLTVVGDYTFRWTISDDTGTCIATDSDVVITVKELTVSNAGPAQNICVDNTTLAANAAAAGETGTWTVVSGSATFGDVNVENTTVTGLGAGDNVLRWTISDDAGICAPPSTSTVTITYTDVTVANAGPAQTICASTTTLAGNAVGANETGTWSVLSEPATASASISSVNDPSTSVTNLTVVGDYTFRWTISDDTGTCIATDSDVVITVKELTVSNAGPAQNICVDNTTLAANAAAAGETGTWTVVSGSATFGDVNVENTTVTGLGAGDNVLRWTISDDAGICAPPSTSTVTITYTDVTVANAGPAQTICASTTTLAGNAVGANETGTWSVLSEPATASASISSVNDPSTSVTNLTVVGDYTFRWTISDDTGTCIATNSDVVITVKELTVSNAGPAQNICVDNTTLAANAVAAGETGTWTVVSGSATFGDVNVENTTVTGLGAGDNVLRWTISDDAGICTPPSASTVTITYTDVTVANAGPAQTICASTTTLAGNAVGANETGTWSVLSEPATASASISSVNDPSTSVTNLTVVGDYTFRWTISDDTGTCIATNSDVVITVKELTVSNAGPAQNICVDNTTLAANAVAAGETGTWTVVSGSATFGDVNVENTTVTGLGAGDNVLRWTISDDAGICAPPSASTVTITYTDVTATETITPTSGCGVTDGAIALTVSSSSVGDTFVFSWTGPSAFTASSKDISGLEDGDYTVTVTSDNTGCTFTATYTVAEPVPFTIDNFLTTNQSQCGVNDGAVSLDVTSGTGPFNYYILNTTTNVEVVGSRSDNDASASYSFASLAPGDYEVFVEDGACTDSRTFTVVAATLVMAIDNATDQTQCGVDDGSVSLTVSTGVGPFNYYIIDTNSLLEVAGSRSDADASTSYSFASLAPGDYEVFVEEGPCTESELFTIDPVVPVVATVDSETPASCGGGADGTITLAITSAGNDFDILVDGVSEGVQASTVTSYTILGLSLGNYAIEVRDVVTNCVVNITEDINENAAYTIDSETKTDITTCGGNEGSITLTVSGGSPTFSWTGPTGFADPGNVSAIGPLDIAGTYQVTLEEAGCSVIRTYNVTAPTPPTAVAGADSTICLPNLTLYADAAGAGETGLWSVVSVPAGGNLTDVTFDDTSSEAAIASGFTLLGDYTLAWTLENSTTGCSNTSEIVITRKDITVSAAGPAQNVCGDAATLAANAVAANETGTWEVVSVPATANILDVNFANANSEATTVSGLLVAGDYVLEWIITDDNSICNETSSQVTITVDPTPTAFAGDDESFCDITEIDLSTLDQGNTPPIAENGTISWSTTSTDGGAFNDNTLETPVYTFGTDDFNSGTVTLTMTVTGTGACATTIVTDELTLLINSRPTIEEIDDDAICYVDANSTYDVAAIVSNQASILWSTSGDGTFDDETAASTFYIPTAVDSAAGTVDLTITAAANGICADSAFTFTLAINSIRIDDATITQTSGCGAADGAIDITMASSSAGDTFDFIWMDEDNNVVTDVDGDVSALEAGIYMVQVTSDNTGCTTQATFEVTDPVPFTVTLGTPTNQTACGTNDGGISATVTGNSANLNYYILDDNSDEVTGSRIDDTADVSYSFSLLAPGDYTLVIEEGACSTSDAFTINPAPAITASIAPVNVTPADCGGGTNGSITVDVVDTGNDFTASITDAANNTTTQNLTAGTTTVLFSGLSQGNYTITIEDDVTTCEVALTQIVNENAAFTIDSFTATDIVNCGAAEGAIDITLGGTLSGAQTFAWTGPAGSNFTASTEDISGLSFAGDYSLTVVDGGCTITQVFSVAQPSACDFNCDDLRVSPITEAATCLGVEDGQIFLFLSNVPNSNTLNVYVKESAQADTEYVSYTLNNPGQGLIVEIQDFFTAGTYNLVIEDVSIACTSDTLNVNIGTKSNVTANVDITQPTCTVSTGSLSVSLSGTADSFTYELYDAADLATVIATNTSGNFNSLAEGSYVIRFINTNNNGCGVADQSVTIENTAVVGADAVNVSIQQPDCGSTTGTITAVLNNLPSNYDFVLVNGAGDEIARNATGIFSDVAVGTYVMQFENRVDPAACVISDRGGLLVENVNAFNAVATNVESIICFGESTGSVVITLEGIGSAYYSLDNGTLWTEFTSGNRITGLPAVNNILISDLPGTSSCELSVAVDITNLNPPIELNGAITLVTQASCTTSETTGEIRVPEVTGGATPYTFSIDGTEVLLTAERTITGLARNVNNLLIEDAAGCSKTFPIASIVSPNEVRAVVEELNPNDNCAEAPEGLMITISQNTIENVSGPYNFIINEVDATETAEFTLDVNATGSSEFLIGPNENLAFNFVKGARYRWTLRSITNEQACSADNIIRINAGAIIPSLDLSGMDAQCNGETGAIEITNIEADEDLPLTIQLFNDREDALATFNLPSVPFSQSFVIDPNNFGFVEAGIYVVQIVQKPVDCNDSIRSEFKQIVVEAPSGVLVAQLVPEPNIDPTLERARNEMNPVPTTRPDKADGSISIRLTSKSGASSYSAQIYALSALPSSGVTLPEMRAQLPTDPLIFGNDDMLTFNNLLPGIYQIEYYDAFGCGNSGNKLIEGEDGTFEIVVAFDTSPFIPNIFTPDGDGINDSFEILNLPDNGAKMTISNRNGAIIYKNDNYRPTDLWDGGDQPDGIYFYQLTIDGNVFNGWVEVLRNRFSR